MGRERADSGRRPTRGSTRRFDSLETTRWTILQGPHGLEYLVSQYGDVLRATIARLVRTGRFPPLQPQDADDVFQSFCVRLLRTDWLVKGPRRELGRFRPFLYRRVKMFLGETSRHLSGHPPATSLGPGADGDTAPAPSGADDVFAAFEQEWFQAMFDACLRRVARADADAAAVLALRRTMSGASRDELAASLAWTVNRYRRAVTAAGRLLRSAWEEEAARFDETGRSAPCPDAADDV